jgi:undecaprenyl-diphosphatase
MLIFQAIILGIVQGLTEFIPISSSAHLIIIPWLLGWNDPVLTSLSFDVALHMGTLLAVLVFFARDWLRLIRAGVDSVRERKIGDNVDRRLAWLIVIGCIPGAIAGMLGESKIEQLFHQPGIPIKPSALIAMAIIIALMACVLLLADHLVTHIKKIDTLSFKDTLIIGLAQALAIFPGVSRSGSTITASLAVRLEREAAARFSFLLGAPIIAGAGLKSFWDLYRSMPISGISRMEWLVFLVGIIAAAVSGFLCIKFLLRYLQKNTTDVFVYYRWALAALLIILAVIRG